MELTIEELKFLLEIIDTFIYEDHVRDSEEIRKLRANITIQILNKCQSNQKG